MKYGVHTPDDFPKASFLRQLGQFMQLVTMNFMETSISERYFLVNKIKMSVAPVKRVK